MPTPLRIKEIAVDRWDTWISGPNPAAVSWRGRVFFSAGAPLDLGGGPLDLPWGASGRLGGDFPADGPPSSQPAWGLAMLA